MGKSISDILNGISIENIDSVKIDNKNNKVNIKLSDTSKKQHDLELSGVDNYHFIDEYIYTKEDDIKNNDRVSFYDAMPWAYMALSYNANGELIKQTQVDPNLVINSKDKSICMRVKSAKLDGDFYPVFKKSFLTNGELKFE